MDLRYPIGKFEWPASVSPADLRRAIDDIAALPAQLRQSVEGLDDAKLDTPYRPDGWTVRQLVHHVADSHMNSYVRFRLAVTENEPTIKPYDEKAWAKLADSVTGPVGLSLDLVDAMHRRWVLLLESFGPSEWSRSFRHPERGPMRVDVTAALYAWHGRHHVAHVTALRHREGW
jgi:hypothetical protein